MDNGRAVTQPRQPHSTQSQDTERQVAGVIARLLLHYYSTSDLSDAARKAVAQDWVEDLVEFGAAAVAQACGEWRRTQTRRPVPAEIRKLCIEAHAVEREREQLRSLPSSAARDEYARSVGWKSEAERMEAIRRDSADREARYERARLVREALIREGGMRPGNAHRAAAEALRANGVTAREYAPTPDEMRTGRIALGIEPADVEAAK